MTTCFHCHAESSREHYARVVENRTPLFGPWTGWRMAGRDLVAPSGERVNPERLRGLLFREAAEARIEARRERKRTFCPVAILPARERFAGRA